MGNAGLRAEKRSSLGRYLINVLGSAFSLRIILSAIYLILVVLLCMMQNMLLFSTPTIRIMNIMASQIVGAKMPIASTWFKVDQHIYGANVTAHVDVKLWEMLMSINVEIPYGYLPQNISQVYRAEDVPCAEFRKSFRHMQVFSLLSIFTGCIVWVFTVSNFFTRMFLPLLWLFLWMTISFTATTVAMMFRVFCDGMCEGEVDAIPPFTSLAMPTGGFAVAFICLQTYLLTSLMAVFL
ncbi:hypothetical protein, unknown function [Leishmania tarentolae]|uniref:Uncharacterized protein n=1 Tax=Leishmania tarentolae TaxID=5689 RepID=A0A640L146_LEITA|nr:hypothetical protein, unknown function [Leishmania tarentolae]